MYYLDWGIEVYLFLSSLAIKTGCFFDEDSNYA